MYVTLEPCCHHGRTPPCTRAIITAGIAEVHLATLDVNPVVMGRGKEELEGAGIRVCVGECEVESKQINEAYAKFITQGTPFVTAKFAMSLDGKIATRSGDSRWISGELARKRVHGLRYTADAVMAGVNTVLVDDPRLTTRCCGSGGMLKKQPTRVIVDSKGRTPLTARVFSEPGKAILVLGRLASAEEKESFAQIGIELLELPSPESRVDLKSLLRLLGERQVTSVLVEGGGILLGALFDGGLVDKVIAFIAPIIIGGREAVTAVAGWGVERVADSFKIERRSVEMLDEDLMVSGYVGGR
jgi:diaminohydroxyphosphoribosylaminopyrimidine deaminase/5-amino-6-(5-phosphoribosylamino)uracil reductase